MRERFAPSPTGYLHLGHAYSALTAWESARAAGGEFALRIEDIDVARCRPEYEAAILEDLDWLGIAWNGAVLRQSERLDCYGAALSRLMDMGLCYPCSCTRRDIAAALAAPQEGAHPDRPGQDRRRNQTGGATRPPVYPGTCRGRKIGDRTGTDAVRLDIGRAIAFAGGRDVVERLAFSELGSGGAEEVALSADCLFSRLGDVVLARKDIGTSYHLAVVVDDAAQDVTHVTRGEDLAESTQLHVPAAVSPRSCHSGLPPSQAHSGQARKPSCEAARRPVGQGSPRIGFHAGRPSGKWSDSRFGTADVSPPGAASLVDSGKEACGFARVAGGPCLFHDKKETVPVTVGVRRHELLDVSRCRALAPQFGARPRPVRHVTGFQRRDDGCLVHPGHHQDRTGLVILRDGGDEPVFVELEFIRIKPFHSHFLLDMIQPNCFPAETAEGGA